MIPFPVVVSLLYAHFGAVSAPALGDHPVFGPDNSLSGPITALAVIPLPLVPATIPVPAPVPIQRDIAFIMGLLFISILINLILAVIVLVIRKPAANALVVASTSEISTQTECGDFNDMHAAGSAVSTSEVSTQTDCFTVTVDRSTQTPASPALVVASTSEMSTQTECGDDNNMHAAGSAVSTSEVSTQTDCFTVTVDRSTQTPASPASVVASTSEISTQTECGNDNDMRAACSTIRDFEVSIEAECSKKVADWSTQVHTAFGLDAASTAEMSIQTEHSDEDAGSASTSTTGDSESTVTDEWMLIPGASACLAEPNGTKMAQRLKKLKKRPSKSSLFSLHK
ncbi:hypothetical protein LPJ53_004792 [Coemansia erecta]|uniref:Uncharacterized protein n=1 Tax=Coemansia erecta TaxID=147472 RepID=A0A9W7XWF6_9FUNG|nr:hypothetical protein LPJ53_004792 [Coemansia erecta]